MKKFWSAATMVLLLCGYGAMWVSAEEAKPTGTDAKATDAKTTEVKAADAKTTEAKPAETKAAESKPAESKAMEKAAKGDAALQAKLEAQEQKIWAAFKAKDAKAAMEVIASDGWSADMTGIAPASAIGSMMQDFTVESMTMQDAKVLPIDKDAAILIYTSNAKATYKGQAIPAGPYYCSTTYVSKGGKWLAVYHQETLAQSGMPNAATTAESTNK
jgi:hypothetical protein